MAKVNDAAQKDMTASLGAEAQKKLVEYEHIVGPPASWQDVKIRASVIAELHRNEMAAIELAYKRREAVTAEWQNVREISIHRVYMDILAELLDFAGDQHAPHKRAEMRKALQDKRIELLHALHGRMEKALEALA